MITWPDVIDDAVKIGLGAVIALFAVVLNNRHESKSYFRNIRVEVIQKSGAQFQTTSKVFLRLYVNYHTYRNTIETAPLGWKAIRDEFWAAVEGIVKNEVEPAYLSIQHLEGALTIVGAQDSALKIAAYRSAVVRLQLKALTADFPELEFGTIEDFEETWDVTKAAEVDAMTALRKDYKSS
jgi:hypothetical protein